MTTQLTVEVVRADTTFIFLPITNGFRWNPCTTLEQASSYPVVKGTDYAMTVVDWHGNEVAGAALEDLRLRALTAFACDVRRAPWLRTACAPKALHAARSAGLLDI